MERPSYWNVELCIVEPHMDRCSIQQDSLAAVTPSETKVRDRDRHRGREGREAARRDRESVAVEAAQPSGVLHQGYGQNV